LKEKEERKGAVKKELKMTGVRALQKTEPNFFSFLRKRKGALKRIQTEHRGFEVSEVTKSIGLFLARKPCQITSGPEPDPSAVQLRTNTFHSGVSIHPNEPISE
jgi:hypothetical protein